MSIERRRRSELLRFTEKLKSLVGLGGLNHPTLVQTLTGFVEQIAFIVG